MQVRLKEKSNGSITIIKYRPRNCFCLSGVISVVSVSGQISELDYSPIEMY